MYPLNTIQEGQIVRVKELSAVGHLRRRLRDIGIIENTRIKCLQKNAAGDLISYFVRGAVIALRNEDSSHILVQ